MHRVLFVCVSVCVFVYSPALGTHSRSTHFLQCSLAKFAPIYPLRVHTSGAHLKWFQLSDHLHSMPGGKVNKRSRCRSAPQARRQSKVATDREDRHWPIVTIETTRNEVCNRCVSIVAPTTKLVFDQTVGLS